MMKKMEYRNARRLMLPGDIICFGGKGSVSSVIKKITRSNVSHVGTILQVNVPTINSFFINQIIESTSLGDGEAGVKINRMSDHIKNYNGDMWWLKLNEETRSELHIPIFYRYLLSQVGKPYDAPQAILSALDIIPDSKENFDKLFCSELVAAALEEAGIFKDINASEITPADVCKFGIFSDVRQLKGSLKELY